MKDKDVSEVFETLSESFQFVMKKASEEKKSSLVILADDDNPNADSLCMSLNSAGNMEILSHGLVALITQNSELQRVFLQTYIMDRLGGKNDSRI